MLRRLPTLLILSILLLAFMAMTASAADKPVEKVRPGKTLSTVYSYPNEHGVKPAGSGIKMPIGRYLTKDPGHGSAGTDVGFTWYDYQHNGRVGRMIDWGPYNGYSPDGPAFVHMAWMQLPLPSFNDRKYFRK